MGWDGINYRMGGRNDWWQFVNWWLGLRLLAVGSMLDHLLSDPRCITQDIYKESFLLLSSLVYSAHEKEVVSYQTRWSLFFIFGFLWWSSRQQRNIVEKCTRMMIAMMMTTILTGVAFFTYVSFTQHLFHLVAVVNTKKQMQILQVHILLCAWIGSW